MQRLCQLDDKTRDLPGENERVCARSDQSEDDAENPVEYNRHPEDVVRLKYDGKRER